MKVLIAGDFCPQNRVSEYFNKEQYNEVLGDVKSIISKYDYSIVNFECPIIYGGEMAIPKRGPNLSCSSNGMIAAQWAGFKCFTIANNHIMDYGTSGLQNTIVQSKILGCDIVGGGMNLEEASKILYKEIDGKIISIINCCEHEFSIATEVSPGANPLDPIMQYYQIQEAKAKSDYVIMIVHGGHEHFKYPSMRMQKAYRFFIDSGADAVINHHQHCINGYEIYKAKPIFYGLGNFCFDWCPTKTNCSWNYGFMAILDFNGENVGYEILPYKQCSDQPRIELLPLDAFNTEISHLNNVIITPVLLKDALNIYYHKCMKNSQRLFEPYQIKILQGVQDRGWMPYFLSTKQRLRLHNSILCESHLDKVEYFFKTKYNDDLKNI